MQLGFTGTRRGMTADQRQFASQVLYALNPSRVHHGDCVGADEEFHAIAWDQGIPIEIHPGNTPKMRAYSHGADLIHNPRPNLDRNGDIVKASSVLLAAPYQEEEVRRSGTWSTIRRAHKERRFIVIVKPDGSLSLYWDMKVDGRMRR